MLPTEDDMRAEALIALWLERGDSSIEDITIQPEGIFERPYSQDILQIGQSETIQGKMLALHISREGLYDMLPEGLFHRPQAKPQRTTSESVQESKRYIKEEKAARKLFLPLEQEFYRQKIWLEHTELRTWLSSVRAENVSLFLDFWGISPGVFTAQQSNFVLAMLPNIHRIVGNSELITYCLEILLQERVQLKSVPSQECLLTDEDMSARLGSFALGVDSVLGDRWINDDPAIEVVIGPIAVSRLLPYLPQGSAHKQLQTLYGFFFPAEADVITSLSIEEARDSFLLVAEEGFARLGLTTTL